MSPDALSDITDNAASGSRPLRNLRRTVVLLSLLAVLFGAGFSWLSWRAEYARQSTQLSVVAEMGERALNAYLGSLDKALQILAEDIRGADGKIDIKAADFQLRRFKKFHPELQVALVTEIDGQILSTSESRPRNGLPSLAAEPSFIISREELQRGARISISHAFRGLISGEWIIPVRYGIRDSDGTVRFVLSVGLPVSKTYSFWKDAPLPPGAALGLLRDDLYLVSRYPVPAGTEFKDLFGHAQKGVLARHLQQAQFPQSGFVDGVSSVSSTAALFAYRRLQDYPLTLGVNNPKSNIWAAWWQDVRVPLLLIALWMVAGLVLYRWAQKQQRAWDVAQQTRLQLAIDAARVGLWMRDFQSNALQWSAEFKRLLGYAPGELKEGHEDWLERLHPDDRAPGLARFQSILDGKIDRYDAEMRLRHRDGAYRTFLSRAVLMHDPSRNTRQLLGAVVDITDRKQAEESLRQSEQNLAITLQSIGDAVIATDAAGLITRMNPTAERLTGWPLAEAAGRPLTEVFRIINAQTRATVIDPAQLVMAHGEVVGLANHTALIARDGSEYQIADSAAPIRDPAGRIVGVVLVFSDVTERYQMESKLQASEQRLRSIIENEPQCVKVVGPNGNLLEMNAAGLAMLEARSLDEVKSHPLMEFIAPEYQSAFGALHRRVMNGEPGALEFEIIGLRGTRRWLETHAAPIPDADTGATLMLGVTQDITERKQTEVVRNQLAAIVENSHDAIFSRALDGTILSWNAGAERMLGYTAAEAIGKSITSTLPPDRPTHLPQNNAALLHGKVVARESNRMTKDGRVIHVWTSVSPIRDSAGNIVGAAVIMHDITALKQADATRTRLAAIVENSHDAIYSRSLDGTILSWNAGAEKMFGYTAAEAIGKPTAIMRPPGRPPDRSQNNDRVIRGEVVARASTRMTKDGKIVHVLSSHSPLRDSSGEVVGVSLILQDITMLKQINDERAQLATIVENAHDVIISRTLDGTITSWNAAAEALFGYAAAEAIGQRIAIIMPAGEEPDIARHSDLLLAGGRIPPTEVVRRTRDERLIHVTRSISPVRNDAGDVIGAAIILRDVSDLKQAEAARASLEAQLRESQKMEAIGTLAGGIAHDFNNIIAAILGNLELARQDAGDSPALQESLTEIHKASTRARDLVQQILSFSRRQPTERKPISLAPVVLESVRLLRATLPARLTLNVHCDAEVPSVMADATQVQQAVINLATNAMQAIPDGYGRIDIRLDTVMLDAPLAKAYPALRSLYGTRPGRTVRLVVNDSGPGMNASTLKRIFEPFFTTKPAGEGTGLGLSVVHGIVEKHEGAIVVESQPGKGTTFTLYLPAAAALAGAPESGEDAAATKPAQTPAAGKHVLYLDDDDALVFLITRLLTRKGYRVSAHTEQR
ncbi:MAG: PAS domain S-box protein, partial [Burkholderiales bacterium]